MHLPVWRQATKELWKRGKVQVLGILEEQHPDRARLFMQWKRMDWPLVVDSLNLLEMPAVPVNTESYVLWILQPKSRTGWRRFSFPSRMKNRQAVGHRRRQGPTWRE